MAKLKEQTALQLAEQAELTRKQENFCHLVALECMRPTLAYEKVYMVSDLAETFGSVTVMTKMLMDHPGIRKRIKELRAPVIKAAGIDLATHLYELAKIRDAAYERGAYPAAVAAEIARGKVSGFYDKYDPDDDSKKAMEPSRVELVVTDCSIDITSTTTVIQ